MKDFGEEINKKPSEIDLVKEYIFTPSHRLLCTMCNVDGYCPTYDCGSLDKLKKLTDRQWQNCIKAVKKTYGDNIKTMDEETYHKEILLEALYKANLWR